MSSLNVKKFKTFYFFHAFELRKKKSSPKCNFFAKKFLKNFHFLI